jgi:hypothetical protein
MINYKHRYIFNQPKLCFSLGKFSKILKERYTHSSYSECRKKVLDGKLPIYFVRYNMDKAMLYVKYLTPREDNVKKLTCVVISMSGKINI